MKKRNYLDFTASKETPFMRDVFIDEVYGAAKKNKDIYFTTPDMGAPSLINLEKIYLDNLYTQEFVSNTWSLWQLDLH